MKRLLWVFGVVLLVGIVVGIIILASIDYEAKRTDTRRYANLSNVTYISFANGEKYMECARKHKDWATARGFSDFRLFTDDDLEEEFTQKNAKIMKYRKGRGLWIWKSHIVRKTLESVPEDHLVIYSDSCSRPDEDIPEFLDRARNFGIAGYQAFQQNKYVSPSCFRDMGAMDQATDNSLIQRWATVIAFKNTPQVREFVSEWEYWCQQEHVIAAPPPHCHDQSLFSVLTHKRKIGSFVSTRKLGHHAFDRNKFTQAARRLFSRW